jgi:hypothetical protein
MTHVLHARIYVVLKWQTHDVAIRNVEIFLTVMYRPARQCSMSHLIIS